jgi:endonuclease/exonuclease/phosphatase family metal-dependent hydrolase
VSERLTLQVRTWNIAHGRDVPPAGDSHRHVRRKHLREMANMMTEEHPDVILLQEVPVWAGDLLREATGMGITVAPVYGAHVPFVHVPLPLAVGASLGRALPDLVRTQLEGQANALLYGPELLLVSARRVQINEHQRFRGEPRVVQLVRLRHRKLGREFVVGNVHANQGENRQQLERAGYLTAQFARGAPAVLGGDLNATAQSPAVRALKARGWQEESSDLAVDHLLVRDFEIEWAATRWLSDRRDYAVNGDRPLRLSDHDPVDAVISA